MNLLLFIITIVVSFIAVRVGAVAFQLTGLEWSLAKFQALSCFSGTGFTTKEAELITTDRQRRRIASVLMVFGNAGLVTLIATFANSLRPAVGLPKMAPSFLPSNVLSRVIPWVNLIIIVAVLYITYRVLTNTKVAKALTDMARRRMLKKQIIKPVTFEELVVTTGGYGVSQIEVSKDSPILNTNILESDLRSRGITILAVQRGAEVMPNPSPNTELLLGDKLICFGKLDSIRQHLCPAPA